MAVTDLTGTKWYFREEYPEQMPFSRKYKINFRSGPRYFEQFEVGRSTLNTLNLTYIVSSYVTTKVYEQGSFVGGNPGFRMIEISDGDAVRNTELINWLETYASQTPYNCVVTYNIVNGTWEDGTTSTKTENVLAGNNPSNVPSSSPNPGYVGGDWTPYDPHTSGRKYWIYQDKEFTINYYSVCNVTFNIVNGTWEDGTADPITYISKTGEGCSYIPSGMTPNPGYSDEGSWTPDPYSTVLEGDTTFTYTFNGGGPVVSHKVTYGIVNGTWLDGATEPQTELVLDGGSPANIPQNMIPYSGYGGGSWSPNPQGAIITTDTIFTYTFTPVQPPTDCTVTYTVENGTWEDGSTTPITETVQSGSSPMQIPSGMIPNEGYEGGAWNPNPIGAVITSDTAFVYTFAPVPSTKLTVTYNVINGKWSDGSTTPKTEKVREGEPPARIPFDMIPFVGYEAGEWSPDPYSAVIDSDTTFTYSFVPAHGPQPKPGIPRMAQVIPYYRIKLGDQTSEWVQKGEYYIDTRSTTNNYDNVDVLEAQCFDSMIKANAKYAKSELTWPALDIDVINEICTKLGYVQDARNSSVLTRSYSLDYLPANITYREALSYIGVMYAANWIFTDAGELRIVPLVDGGDILNIGKSAQNITQSPKRIGYTKVSLVASYGLTYNSGDSDENVMTAECKWATQEIADYVYNVLKNYTYHPHTADGVWADPSVELCDTVQIGQTRNSGDSFSVFSRDLDFGSIIHMDLAAPNDNYIDHEYYFESPVERQTNEYFSETYTELQEIRERYPKIGWDTVVLDTGKEPIETEWTLLDKDYLIPKDGWYMLEGTVVYNGTNRAPRGVALSVDVGGKNLWTLAGTSWVFNDVPTVDSDMSDIELMVDLKYDVSVYNSDTGQYHMNCKGTGLYIYASSGVVLNISYYYIYLDEPYSVMVYQYDGGWTHPMNKEIQYIYGGRDDKGLSLINFFKSSAVRSIYNSTWIIDEGISGDQDIDANIPFTVCGNTGTVYSGIRIETASGIGVVQILYKVPNDEPIVVYDEEYGWYEDYYRYIDFTRDSYSATLATQYADLLDWLFNNAEPNYGLYDTRWLFKDTISVPFTLNTGPFFDLMDYMGEYEPGEAYNKMLSKPEQTPTGLEYVPYGFGDYAGMTVWSGGAWVVQINQRRIQPMYDIANTQLYPGVTNNWQIFLSQNATRLPDAPRHDPEEQQGRHVRLIAKNEVDSSYLGLPPDADVVAELTATCTVQLKKNNKLHMYAKLQVAGENRTYLKIHGPTA